MSFAYLPLYTGDYLRDTRHLTPMRHGIYLLALMHCWDSKGPMPLDEQECAGICNCRSADEVDALRYIMDRYFILMDDGNYNKRIAEEVAKSERLAAAFSEAGLKSAEVRREKARAGTRAKLNAKTTKAEGGLKVGLTKVEPRSVSPSPSPSLIHTNTTNTPRGSAGGGGFEIFWQAYPRKIAKGTALKAFERIAPSTDLLDEIVAAVHRQKTCQQWTKDGGQFIPHPASWLNAARWQDETEPGVSAFGGAV